MTADPLTRLTDLPRERLATLPTPLEPAGHLPSGRKWFIKRDDLSGLGMGGNKARKLELLTADARARGADTLVTVGAAQSNHARMTAAAGTRLGMPTHLVLGGEEPVAYEGNQLLAALFGARFHYPGTDDWDELEGHMDDLEGVLRTEGRTPYRMPIGGSTPLGAGGFALAWCELLDQCAAGGVRPASVVHATSSGGTHAGLLAGKALRGGPAVVAIAVAKTSQDLASHARQLAEELLDLLGADIGVGAEDIDVDGGFQGPAYAVPTEQADEAISYAAATGGWVLDRVYTAKALAGLLARDRDGSLPDGDVVFWHTGGLPTLFAREGAPAGVPARRSTA